MRKRYQKDSLANMKNSGEIHEQLVTYDEEGGGEMDTNGYVDVEKKHFFIQKFADKVHFPVFLVYLLENLNNFETTETKESAIIYKSNILLEISVQINYTVLNNFFLH